MYKLFLIQILFISFLGTSSFFDGWRSKVKTTTEEPIFAEELEEFKNDPDSYTHSQMKNMRGNLHKLKRLFMKVLFLGQQKRYEFTLEEGVQSYEMMEGVFIIIHCPGRKKNDTVFWYKNGHMIKNEDFMQWRFSVSMVDYSLFIQPLLKAEDIGTYECKHNGSIISRADISIIDQTEAYVKGLLSYLLTVLFVTPVVVAAVIYRMFKPEIKESELEIKKKNNLVLFYEEMLLNREKKHDVALAKKMKEAVDVYKNKMVQKKMESFRQIGLIDEKENNNEDNEKYHRSMRDVLKNVTKIAERRTMEYNDKLSMVNKTYGLRKRIVTRKNSVEKVNNPLNV
uniref:Ig-like domain-containing protein n=1 Tax=Strongyloides papillosus TaxID=174720 RepID=A0A0N5C378_STREA